MTARSKPVLWFVLVAGVLLLAGCAGEEEPAAQFVPQAAVEAALATLPSDWGIASAEAVLAEQPFLVDVREPGEYATGFIEGAVNIPLRTLAQHLEALPGLEEEIVVTCCSGPRAAVALTALRALGYQRVRLLAGGVNGWRATGLPLVGGPGPGLAAGPSAEIDRDLRAAVDDYLANRAPASWGQVSLADFEKQLEEAPPYVLDVRQSEEMEGGGPEGSINIPLHQLPGQLERVPKDRPVVVIDASGHRSTIAMAALQMLGYDQVSSLSGGVMGWQAAGGCSDEYQEMTEALNAFLAAPPPEWGLVSAEAALAIEPFWLDVREPDAYAAGFIEGAVNGPLPELVYHLDVLPDQAETIVVVSDSNARSAIAMLALQLLGYQQALSLDGGLAGWEAAGLPLVTGPTPGAPPGEFPAVDARALESLAHYLGSPLLWETGLVDVPGLFQAMGGDRPGTAMTVIDVREPEAYANDPTAGTVNLPLRDLLEGVGEIPAEPLRTS